MTMNSWMTIWLSVLTLGVVGFALLLLLVSAGAVRELKETLNDLREDTLESAEHPEELDKLL